jgi:hypothetical protein
MALLLPQTRGKKGAPYGKRPFNMSKSGGNARFHDSRTERWRGLVEAFFPCAA